MTVLATRPFQEQWRRRKSAAFDLQRNSTAGEVVAFDLWGREVVVYANTNLSIYSGEQCNAACPFCVEELRPASRGAALAQQKTVEPDDDRYFRRLNQTLAALVPLAPTISITGGEPSRDPRLPRILRSIESPQFTKRTLTTNGSGLLERREDLRVIDWIGQTGVAHVNISVAHPDPRRNARAMRLTDGLSIDQLAEVVQVATAYGVRVRLSCVLLRIHIASFADVLSYLAFAQTLGVDNVIFRQLMLTDPVTHRRNHVIRFSDSERVRLEPLLDQVSRDGRFEFVRQVMGYYYYVEVWKYGPMDVVFEEADLAQLEVVKRRDATTIHELVFHPNGCLAATWQPWDRVLGPPD
jgi:molybdenum cofactor biosynthesis enzyme MoaA